MLENSNFVLRPVQVAVNQADVVFLATPFKVNQAALEGVVFNEKTLIYCTNPVGLSFTHGLNNVKSGSESVQEWASNAKVVKSFSIYGVENFRDSSFPNYAIKPAMLIAGNDAAAKKQVEAINADMGYETVDTGGLNQALHLEHMTLMWVKMARMSGHHPNFVWGYLEK